jgi:hypothetical protein
MFTRKFHGIFAVLAGVALVAGMAAAQDAPTVKRGRKYKSPPVTAHIEVLVQKVNGKPIMNAAVIFHPVKDGKDDGNLEMKTDPDGKAVIDVIPVGSTMRVQVIANGYASFGEDYDVPTDSKNIVITMKRPVEQFSTYRDSNGQAAQQTPGVQEPVRPTNTYKPPTPGVLPISPEPNKTAPAAAAPASGTPPQQ